MRDLIPLQLPQRVERERKRNSSTSSMDSPTTGHSHQWSQSSTASDIPSPTFSLRGHSRMQSSASSTPSSPTLRDSSENWGAGKRPLTEVKEEPQEKDEDYEMVGASTQCENIQGQSCESAKRGDSHSRSHPSSNIKAEEPCSPQISQPDWYLEDSDNMRYMEYDLCNQPFGIEYAPHSTAKRQRADGSPLSGLASKVGSRMPSFSQKFRSRKASPIIPPLSREASVSRANSTRAPSIVSANFENSRSFSIQLPPTPTQSQNNESFDGTNSASADFPNEREDERDDFRYPVKPATPLLPPVITDLARNHQEVEYQSPLDSPSIAAPSVIHSPIPTPQIGGLPSPPLSTKPSIASFHRRQHAAPLVPSSEIPPMLISPPPADKWADALGHANFTIQPEPYTMTQVDLEACKNIRQDWDKARHNYAQHLVRVGETSGPTSKIYHLTEQKWAEVNATWKNNVDACVNQLNEQLNRQFRENSSEVSIAPIVRDPVGREFAKTPPMVKIPAIHSPWNEGKFPGVGDEGIVGPMEVALRKPELGEIQEHEQQQAQGTRRKRKFGGFIKDWLIGVRMLGGGRGQDVH